MTQRKSDLPKGLSAPAMRALTGAGYVRLEQLTRVSEAELKKLHGLGPHGINLLRNALNEKGLSFAEEKSDKG
jgi:DNA-directed RNA polymerase alpha subunit